jgi:hypothetical protein
MIACIPVWGGIVSGIALVYLGILIAALFTVAGRDK